jgi:hypothetical protein
MMYATTARIPTVIGRISKSGESEMSSNPKLRLARPICGFVATPHGVAGAGGVSSELNQPIIRSATSTSQFHAISTSPLLSLVTFAKTPSPLHSLGNTRCQWHAQLSHWPGACLSKPCESLPEHLPPSQLAVRQFDPSKLPNTPAELSRWTTRAYLNCTDRFLSPGASKYDPKPGETEGKLMSFGGEPPIHTEQEGTKTSGPRREQENNMLITPLNACRGQDRGRFDPSRSCTRNRPYRSRTSDRSRTSRNFGQDGGNRYLRHDAAACGQTRHLRGPDRREIGRQ